MSDFVPEKLIPFIRITRKIKAFNNQQQLTLLQQLPQIFEAHHLTSLLMNIVFSGIFDREHEERIPLSIYSDIQSILPSDTVLNMKDSIYDSRLVETIENPDGDKRPNDQQKKKLPLTLLRIPSDLQFHLFHYLNYKELIKVQKTCRALCIVARNPLSVYSLVINHELSRNHDLRNHKFCAEYYSRPQSLTIDLIDHVYNDDFIDPRYCVSRRSTWNSFPSFGNTKWGDNVKYLSIEHISAEKAHLLRNIGQFVNLQKCILNTNSLDHLLLEDHIASQGTLIELSLYSIEMTDGVVDKIREFENLEILSVSESDRGDRRISRSKQYDPVSLPRLRRLTFYDFSPLFVATLIGSHPETVKLYAYNLNVDCTSFIPRTEAAVNAICAVKYFHVDTDLEGITALLPLLQKAKSVSHPIFEECKLTVILPDTPDNRSLQPMITLLECGRHSKLELRCTPDYSNPDTPIRDDIVHCIKTAEFNIFNEVTVERIFVLQTEHAVWDFHYHHESGQEAAKNVVMESIDKAEKWMRSWLIFDERNMRQIGLRKLDVKFKYKMAFIEHPESHYWNINDSDGVMRKKSEKLIEFQAILRTMTDVWFRQRVNRWSDIDSRCVSMLTKDDDWLAKDDDLAYTVSLSLRSRRAQLL